MKIALIFAIIGLIGCLYGLYKGIMKEKMGGVIVNIIFIFADLFVIGKAIGWDKPTEVKYKMVDNVVCVNVDSVFTKTKIGVDTTYNIHYLVRDCGYWETVQMEKNNLKHIEVDSVFTKTNEGVDTTYVINYEK